MTESCQHKNIELLIQDIEKRLEEIKKYTNIDDRRNPWTAGYYAGLKDALDGIKFLYELPDCSICKKED